MINLLTYEEFLIENEKNFDEEWAKRKFSDKHKHVLAMGSKLGAIGALGGAGVGLLGSAAGLGNKKIAKYAGIGAGIGGGIGAGFGTIADYKRKKYLKNKSNK